MTSIKYINQSDAVVPLTIYPDELPNRTKYKKKRKEKSTSPRDSFSQEVTKRTPHPHRILPNVVDRIS